MKKMISVIIPFYNEDAIISAMLVELKKHMDLLALPYEIISIDDGSTDHTLNKLKEIKKEFKQLKIISLSRNFGLQAAITAGMEYAVGEYVVLMDGDLQDPPELIAEMYDKLKDGENDLAIGRRSSRKEPLLRRIAIKSFHVIYRSLSGLEDIYNTGNFCMMNREVVDAILQINEKTRYIPGLRSFVGFKRAYVEYHRDERKKGEPKMTFSHLLSLAADAIFSFSKWPIKMCLWLGFLGVFLLLVAGIYSIISKFSDWAPLGWSSTILSIYFIGTIQLIFLGVIGEYLYRIYKEVQKRPLFIVKKFIE